MSALADVLDALARAVDDDPPDEAALGEITLRAHQRTAVRDIRAAFAEFGGALLADDPGLGKTYTALAIARDYGRCTVAAPAALRPMWRDACARTRIDAAFISLEAISLGKTLPPAALLIVDEAHRAANTATARYRALAFAAERKRVLLLTATPVRNRRSELDALLGLFLGGRAAALADDARARCIIHRSASGQAGIPAVQSHERLRPRGGRGIERGIRALPDPLPMDDGSAAGALVRAGLARYWSSSESALERALGRRLQRGLAMRDMLDAGQRPTREEIRAWVVGEDATQMAFAFGSPGEGADLTRWRRQLDAHITGVSALRQQVARSVRLDSAWRGSCLLAIAERHTGSIVVAFTTFEATAQSVFGAVRNVNGTVLLTGRGARAASGPLDRHDVVARLRSVKMAASPQSPLDIRLVIATDLLSEGVNLQGASVIVHLDQPWTPAAVAQRIGRAARLGSMHETVHEYRFCAPRAAERLLSLHRYHARKRVAARDALGSAVAHQRLRQIAMGWRATRPERAPAACAAAPASVGGFIARLDTPSRAWILGGEAHSTRPLRVTPDSHVLVRLAESLEPTDVAAPTRIEVDRAMRAVAAWIARQRALAAAGAGLGQSQHRRRLLVRLDSLLDAAPVSRRPVLAARVGRLRAVLFAARGAAVDLNAIALLAHAPDSERWLDEVERRLSAHSVADAPPLGPVEVSALLILRKSAPTAGARATAAASPAPRPCPPSASTEIAAPR